jgi:glyoxylase-like metal-dependent hydrolase (beta-lactamase superfamily II)
MTQSIYFKQLELGPMQNYVYLVGDPTTREAAVVDAAWDIDTILQTAEADGYRITRDLVTHFHPDHLGGAFMGHSVIGAAELVARVPAKVVVHKAELPFVHRITGLSDSDVTAVEGGDDLMIGNLKVKLLHTPGHTPGSQCFLVDGRLVSGDTLFLDGCGRTDLPGGDPEALYESLTQKLGTMPDDTVLFPGHMYSAEPFAPMSDVRQYNFVFRPRSKEQWLMMFGD